LNRQSLTRAGRRHDAQKDDDRNLMDRPTTSDRLTARPARLGAITALVVASAAWAWPAAPQESVARSGSLTVRISAPGATTGEIGCALYASADGFPLDMSRSTARQSHPAGTSVTCTFDRLAAGTYAVAVSHDANSNGRTDRNFLGVPKEAWGVSRGVRPSMRAPRFDEAAVKVDGPTEIAVEVKR
jgi:uncharacterized protein (DUF2141 family)